jgi:hypothetical protein
LHYIEKKETSMATKRENQIEEPEEIGKAHPVEHAGERARDEQREGGGPRYGGEAWDAADARGEKRFGVARNDDADPSETSKGAAVADDDGWPGDERAASVSDVDDDGKAENGGQQAGFGRGEEPRKPKSRSKR